ncbi:cationic peroxidase 2-like [Senna tora]|uniref:Peroxidase n=1 Tax=Senna tora TaxID=362788 RepID=A0A834W4A0_9FABA|nr:cationic peroxidase 2-like [Senna tora]
MVMVFLLLVAAGNTSNRSLVVEAEEEEGTRVGFYSKTCPHAESIVRSSVQHHYSSNPSVAAGLLRMHFHDCFVRGCDASILISGPNTEQASPANAALNGFHVIHDAKKHLEDACPGIVSCADILALAARDSVVLSGGESWKVRTGRRDGRVSNEWEAAHHLPSPMDPLHVLKHKFELKGLNVKHLVTLTGAHSIGSAACKSLGKRLVEANVSDSESENFINPRFLPKLEKLCPRNDDVGERRIALDTCSQLEFDTSYFFNIKNGGGILPSDQALWSHGSTRKLVRRYLSSSDKVFYVQFGKSMVKMSNIGVKTGSHGEIRTKCHAVN